MPSPPIVDGRTWLKNRLTTTGRSRRHGGSAVPMVATTRSQRQVTISAFWAKTRAAAAASQETDRPSSRAPTPAGSTSRSTR